ncbi:MAG: type IV secretion system protein [Alphaproteobacteria bacterium]|nr:type IV secretion system protein [Alphaproteobacteria bacterium]
MKKFIKIITLIMVVLPLFAISTSPAFAQQEEIDETNRILDAISSDSATREDIKLLRHNMEIVNKIPENKRNEQTKALLQKYENSPKAKLAVTRQNYYEKRDEAARQLNNHVCATGKGPDAREECEENIKKEVRELKAELIVLENVVEGCKHEYSYMPYCKYEKVTTCFLCPIFAAVFNTVNKMTETAFKRYSNSVARVVVVAFGIWLAIQILAFAASMETKDLKTLGQMLITQGFIVLLVVVILQNGVYNFFNAFIEPVYTTGQKAAQAMFADNTITPCLEGDTSCHLDENNYINYDIKQGFSPSIGESVIQTMTVMENYVRKFKALGSSFMHYAFKFRHWFIFPSLSAFLSGLLIWALSWVLIIGIPFLMIDAVFQLGVAGALMPLAVGAYAFKSTRSYTKKVWETVLNSMFSFVFISIVVLLVLSVLKIELIEDIQAIMGEADKGRAEAEFAKLFEASTLTGDSKVFLDKMVDNFTWLSQDFLKLIFVLILAWSVMKMAQEFAGEIAGSLSSTAIGSSIGTMAASSAKNFAWNKVSKPLAERGTKAAGRFIMNKGRAGVHLIKGYRAEKEIEESKKKMGAGGTYTDKKGFKHTMSEDGETELITQERTLSSRVSSEANGNIRTTSTKKKIERHKTKEMIIEITRVYQEEVIKNKEGQVVKTEITEVSYEEKITFDGLDASKLMSRSGQFNAELMDKVLQGKSAEEQKLIKRALMKSIHEQRFGEGKEKLQKEPELVRDEIIEENGEQIEEIIYKKTATDGTITFETTRIKKNGLVETQRDRISANGKRTSLASDGIRNRMIVSKLKDPTQIANIAQAKNFAELNELLKNNSKETKKLYAYSKWAQDQIDRGVKARDLGFDENGNQLGMFSQNEVLDHRDANGYRVKSDFSAFVDKRSGNEFDKADMRLAFKI